MAIRNNSNSDKKTTTTTTVKTLKGKIPPISPMKSAEAYAEQAQQGNLNSKNSKNTNTKITDTQSSLLKRLGIAGAIVAVLLGGLFAVEHFNKPEKPNETLPPLSSPLVIPDAPSLASNNPEKPVFLEIQPPMANSQNSQNLQNPENLQNQSDIFAPPETNVTAEKSSDEIAKIDLTKNNTENNSEKSEKNSQNLVENKLNPQNISQLPAADSFGTFGDPVLPPSNQSKNNNAKMQQGGHTILKLNQPQSQNPPSKKPEIATIAEKPNVEKSTKQIPRTSQLPTQLPQNFVAEETFAPPMLGNDKTGSAIADSKNLPNTRIVSMSKSSKNNTENSVIPNDKYRIQAGVFDSKVNPQSAENLYQKLVSAGIPAVLENRVQVGPFANKAQAEKAQQKLKELGITGVIVVPKN